MPAPVQTKTLRFEDIELAIQGCKDSEKPDDETKDDCECKKVFARYTKDGTTYYKPVFI
ncbi:hypothetical protein FPOAC1_007811 [Fusarium poae]|uniref:hypothetical protein n=1 Tax=Fusarium poae TaxID=36050 RepID=UPI001CE83DC4|nr:hypothetical protein FPOAC1_007811 [Fusarium poae]KAG8668432.1 hypothetical protein FPOAC1_007811 [Fusarium poae]